MKNYKIVVVYSPLCEASGAFIGKIHDWLENENIEIEECSYEVAKAKYKELVQRSDENCFIDVYYEGNCIDSIPLHKEHLLAALNIENNNLTPEDELEYSLNRIYTEEEIITQIQLGNVQFIPITKETYLEEMSMCLSNYPRGNPSMKYHNKCIQMKEKVYTEVFQTITVAGVYAKLDGTVIGLLEIFPREIVKKYGYMTGTLGKDDEILTVTCYEIGYGIPRTLLIDKLMHYLLDNSSCLQRNILEGIGIFEWKDGFNPYWVYDKYGFHRTEQKNKNTVVMTRRI